MVTLTRQDGSQCAVRADSIWFVLAAENGAVVSFQSSRSSKVQETMRVRETPAAIAGSVNSILTAQGGRRR